MARDDRSKVAVTRLTNRFSEAVTGATGLHAGQVRKGTTSPYVAHLLGVTAIALHYGADEDEAIAALLHDAIEDAPPQLGASWVRTWIRFRFGERVLQIVEGCTDSDVPEKPPWLERKRAYVAHITPQTDASVVLVSAADKLHNTTAILHDVRREGDAVFGRFNTAGGKRDVIGYYRGLVDAYKATGHHPTLVRELDRVVADLEQEAGAQGAGPFRRGEA